MLEIFVPIKDFEGRYEVSNHGRVRSIARCISKNRSYPAKDMKLHVHTNKYQVVWLRKPGVHQKFYVHRLVAHHFIPTIEGKEYVNHKDKNRLNNHVSNLEFMTHQENCDHRDGRNPINNDEPF